MAEQSLHLSASQTLHSTECSKMIQDDPDTQIIFLNRYALNKLSASHFQLNYDQGICRY